MVKTADIALEYHQQGRFTEAVEAYDQALGPDPAQPDLLFKRAAALSSLGRQVEAMDCLKRAVACDPLYAEAHFNLANLQKQRGAWADARRSYLAALDCKPTLLVAHYNLANLLQEQGDFAQAVDHYQQALTLDPHYVRSWVQLGRTLRKQGRFDQAQQCYEQGLQANPASAELHSELGKAQADRGDYSSARASLQQALRLSSEPAGLYCNLGALHALEARYEEAIVAYDRALALDGEHAMARWNRALLLLQRGAYREGWQQYQWRHNTPLMTMANPHYYDAPTWTGLPYRGSRLLVHHEQGFGDLFQFARYLPWVKRLGGTLLVEVPNAAAGLFEDWSCIDRVIVDLPKLRSRPAYDIQCSLLDLPHLARTTLETIPCEVPYLHAHPGLAARWTNRFDPSGISVGLVWSGSPVEPNRLSTLKLNACRLADFEPLSQIPALRLYGLQKGPAAQEVHALSPSLLVSNLGPTFNTFSDTAAAISHLDLVLSVDTAVAHLAAAMGTPTWLLLRHESEWRWMLNRDDSPWYPTMRLFRQAKGEGWMPVIKRVCQQLRETGSVKPRSRGDR